MSKKAGFIRSFVDALVAGRQRSADRYVDTYLKEHGLAPRAKERPWIDVHSQFMQQLS